MSRGTGCGNVFISWQAGEWGPETDRLHLLKSPHNSVSTGDQASPGAERRGGNSGDYLDELIILHIVQSVGAITACNHRWVG